MRRLLLSPVGVIGWAAVAAVFWGSYWNAQKKTEFSREYVDQLTQQTASTAAAIHALESAIELEESPLTKERKLRNELLQARPGELLITLPPDVLKPPQPTPQPTTPPTPWEEWQQLLRRAHK